MMCKELERMAGQKTYTDIPPAALSVSWLLA
jgi:hypothetical protein